MSTNTYVYKTIEGIDKVQGLYIHYVYLFKNNKWHRWSKRKGDFVKMTQSWIDKYED